MTDRRLLLPVLALAHGALLLALLGGVVKRPAEPGALQLIAVAPAAASAPAPAIALEPIAADLPPPTVEIEPDPAPSGAVAATAIADGSACDVTGLLGRAVADDAAAQRALAAIPQSARSVAGALMIWDRRWVQARSASAAPIRAAVVAALETASPACREQPVAGPRMIAVADAGRTTLLVFGSGAWKWSEVVSSP